MCHFVQGVIVACRVPVTVATKMDEIQIEEQEVLIVLDRPFRSPRPEVTFIAKNTTVWDTILVHWFVFCDHFFRIPIMGWMTINLKKNPSCFHPSTYGSIGCPSEVRYILSQRQALEKPPFFILLGYRVRWHEAANVFFSTELVIWREVDGSLRRVLLLQSLWPQSYVQFFGDVNHLVLSPLQVAAYWKQVQQRCCCPPSLRSSGTQVVCIFCGSSAKVDTLHHQNSWNFNDLQCNWTWILILNIHSLLVHIILSPISEKRGQPNCHVFFPPGGR